VLNGINASLTTERRGVGIGSNAAKAAFDDKQNPCLFLSGLDS